MGIEELIGFILGVACGGLLRYLRGENGTQAGVSAGLLTQQPASGAQSAGATMGSSEAAPSQPLEPSEPSVSSATTVGATPLVPPSELGEPTPTASAAVDVGGTTQQVATEESAVSPAVEEKKADLKTAILEILRSSEEGLTLSAIAEQLKRHFASIIGPVRLLIEEGLIEKQDKIYKIRGTA